MKRLMALIGMIGHNKAMRTMLASGIVIALGSAEGIPTAWAGNQGHCPAYNAASVDENFLAWSATTGFDESSGTILCADLHSGPYIAFQATVDGYENDKFFRVIVIPSPPDPTLNAAWGISSYSYDDMEYWSNTDDYYDFLLLSVDQGYACQAEILRSFTWRQYCAMGAVTQP